MRPSVRLTIAAVAATAAEPGEKVPAFKAHRLPIAAVAATAAGSGRSRDLPRGTASRLPQSRRLRPQIVQTSASPCALAASRLPQSRRLRLQVQAALTDGTIRLTIAAVAATAA